MNLLLVTGRFPERSETFIYRKAVGLAKRGHNVTVAVRQVGDWTLYPEPIPNNLHIVKLLPDDALRRPGAAAAAIRGVVGSLMRRPLATRGAYRMSLHGHSRQQTRTLFLRHLPFAALDADVVHFEFLSIAAMYPYVGRLMRCPTVISSRGSDLYTLELRSEPEQRAFRSVLDEADAIHCVSSRMAADLARMTNRSQGVWVSRPAVEVERIGVRSPSPTSRPLKIIATGRLVWKKGFDYLLAALARLAKRGIDFTAEIIGDGELKNFLRFSIEDLALEGRVHLVGGVDSAEVLGRMRAADVFVLPSVSEGISNAVLEAMATGLPIITTDAGGMREAVRDGNEGFVVPVRDVAALTDRLEELARHPELRARMGDAARARAEAEFALPRQLDELEAMYRALTGRLRR